MRAIPVDVEKWFSDQSPGRECGPCTACCVWLGIEELKKFTGEKCKHLRSSVYKNRRCGIYAARPEACREYKCFWRTGWGPEDMRPHESGILVTPYPDHDDDSKVSFTATIFDMEKAEGKINEVIAALMGIPITTEVRLINVKSKKALLFKNGKIYDCKLLPAEGYEALMFEAQDTPVGRYLQQEP